LLKFVPNLIVTQNSNTMKPTKILSICIIAAAFLASNCLAQSQGNGPQLKLSTETFVENQGQVLDTDGNQRPDVKYYSNLNGEIVYIMNNMLCHAAIKADSINGDSIHRLDIEFIGANSNVQVSGMDNTQGYMNYFLGHIPNGVTNVPTWDKIRYTDLYPNIDLEMKVENGKIKYGFNLRQGANPADIQMEFKGADKIEMDKNGRLMVKRRTGGDLEFVRPKGLERVGNKVIPVSVSFKKTGNVISLVIKNSKNGTTISINTEAKGAEKKAGHAPSPTPIPGNSLPWATYYGDAGWDRAKDVYIDGNNNIYMVGFTTGPDFPVFAGLQSFFGGGTFDAFVVKFNSQFGREWATLYGGDGADDAYGVVVDAVGDVYFTGVTSSSNFPLPCATCTTGYSQALNGANDAFIVKLAGDGMEKLWSTYFGGDGTDAAYAIALSGSSLYIIGRTASTANFPLEPVTGSYNQSTNNGGTDDGFIAKFNTSGTKLWCSYFGGEGKDVATSCTIDNSGNLFITGYSKSAGTSSCTPLSSAFPLCDPGGSAYVQPNANTGFTDIFIAKFNSANILQWSTMYGGSSHDGFGTQPFSTNGIETDGAGRVYLTGNTMSSDFPTLDAGGYYEGVFQGGNRDAFLLGFSNLGIREWGTFIGGSDTETGLGIAIDVNDNLFVTGFTISTDFPTKNKARIYNQPTFNGGSEAFVMEFDQTTALEWSTFFGGDMSDQGLSIAVKDPFYLIIVGETASSDYPALDVSLQFGPDVYYDGTFNGGTADAQIANFFGACSPCLKLGEANGEVTGEDSEVMGNSLFKLYPNPNNGRLTIEIGTEESQRFTIEIYDLMGKKVYAEALTFSASVNSQKEMNLSRLGSGIYLVQVMTGNTVYNRKLIIE